jgi:hypothetical protein
MVVEWLDLTVHPTPTRDPLPVPDPTRKFTTGPAGGVGGDRDQVQAAAHGHAQAQLGDHREAQGGGWVDAWACARLALVVCCVHAVTGREAVESVCSRP